MTLIVPFNTSLIPTSGSGTFTFSRASAGRVRDNEGKSILLPTNVARLSGARAVVNLVDSSEGSYSSHVGASSVASNPDIPSGYEITTSCKLVEDNTTGNHTGTRSINVTNLGTYKVRQYFKPAGRNVIQLTTSGFPFNDSGSFAIVDLITGVVTGTTSDVTASLLANGWIEVISLHLGNSVGNKSIITTLRTSGATYAGDGVSGVLNTGIQAENITGQAVQTNNEYVPVGVLPAPYYGAGTDGVKYFNTNKDGSSIDPSTIFLVSTPDTRTNTALWSRDFTNAAWVKTNVTPALTATGIDGKANACSELTFTANNGTILQTITAAPAAACTHFEVKRSAGTGAIFITRDNGSTWTDITSQINSSTFSNVGIFNTSVTNPVIGFKGSTSGDKIIVDATMNELGTTRSAPIFTTTAAVSRSPDVLTYQTSGNISDTAGTILATIKRDDWTNGNGVAVGKVGSGLSTSSSNSGAQALDGTNTVNGPAGATNSIRKIGMKWSGSSMKVFAGGKFGAPGSYDGSLNLSTIAIMPGVNGFIRGLSICDRELTDDEMISAASTQASMASLASADASFIDNYFISASMAAEAVGSASFIDNYIVSSSFAADSSADASFSNNYIISASLDAESIATAIFVTKSLLSSKEITLTYHRPTITLSI